MPPCRHTSVAPRCPGLGRAAGDLVQVEVVGLVAVAEIVPALGEGAELAAVGADVGVVDVAVDDVGDGVADALRAQPVGRPADGREIRARARRTAPRCRLRPAPRPPRPDRGCAAIAADGRAIARPLNAGDLQLAGSGSSPPGAHPSSRASPAASICRSSGVRSAGSIQLAPLPPGRGREAMTYGRVRLARHARACRRGCKSSGRTGEG